MTGTELRSAVSALVELNVPDPRAVELALRLVAPGPKACAVSASESHEITEAVLAIHGSGGHHGIAVIRNAAPALLDLADAVARQLDVIERGGDAPDLARALADVRRAYQKLEALP